MGHGVSTDLIQLAIVALFGVDYDEYVLFSSVWFL